MSNILERVLRSISVERMMESLPVMGYGMLGIFMVMLIIFIVTLIMSKVGAKDVNSK